MKRHILAVLTVAMAAPAVAQTQAAMNQRAGAEWRAADAAMTREWNVRYAYMKGRDAQNTSRGGGFGYAPALLESQRAWLKYRDAQCVVEGGQYAGGSMQPMARAQCLTRMTRARSQELRGMNWDR